MRLFWTSILTFLCSLDASYALYPQDSTDTLVGSALKRKLNEQDSIRENPDTIERLEDLRRLMIKDKLDY